MQQYIGRKCPVSAESYNSHNPELRNACPHGFVPTQGIPDLKTTLSSEQLATAACARLQASVRRGIDLLSSGVLSCVCQ